MISVSALAWLVGLALCASLAAIALLLGLALLDYRRKSLW